MDFERSRSAPTQNNARLGAAPPPAHFFDVEEFNFDDFKFDSDDQCLSGSFAIRDDLTDDKTVCSEPPNPATVMKKRPHRNRKVSANYSPKSVHDLMERISEDEDDQKLSLWLREGYSVDNRKPDEGDPKHSSSLREGYSVDSRRASDITEVISNTEHGESPKRVNSGVTRNRNLVTMGTLAEHVESPKRVNSGGTRNPNLDSMRAVGSPKRDIKTEHVESPKQMNSGVTRSPNLVSTGSSNKHPGKARDKQHQPQYPHQRQQKKTQKKAPKRNMFQRIFSCGAPEVFSDFTENGVDTVEEVKGSFGDLGLTVKQVFSPVKNTKAGAGMVKEKVREKIVTKVKEWEDVEVEYEEFTDDDGDSDDDDENVTDEDDNVTDEDDDNATDEDDGVVDFDASLYTDDSSFVGTDSGSEYTDEFSEGSY
mmetsp:Transcript_12521/g.19294  ORF Transcript_12521/g.19294 Transcript_12521/m.19294 type:complete len:423 (-) Transcript_12521:42-1310(-)